MIKKTIIPALMIAIMSSAAYGASFTSLKQYIVDQKPDTIASKYDRSWPLTNSLTRVLKNGKTGVIDNKGLIIIPVEFRQIWDVDKDNNIKVLYANKLGIYNIRGEIVIPAEYDNIWLFHNGMAKVIQEGRTGYISSEGKIIIPCRYEQIWDFENGMARVMRNGLLGYVTMDGGEIIPTEYQQIWSFNNGRARVLKNGKIGYIDEKGVEVIPPIFTQIWEFDNGKAKAIFEGNIVMIDETGTIVGDAPSQEEYVTSTAGDTIIHHDKTESSIKIIDKTVRIIREYTTNQHQHEDASKPKSKFRGHYFGIDLGFNNFVTSGLNFTLPDEYSFLDMNDGKSVAVALNILQFNTELNKAKTLGFVTGLGIEFNNYRFDSNKLLTKTDSKQLGYIESSKDVRKNKLAVTYLTAPLLLEYQFDIHKKGSPLFISAGPVLGLKLKSHTKTIYYGSKIKEKQRDDFYLNDFRYGLMARIGTDDFVLTASYYLSPLFYTNKGPEVFPVSLSLGISLNP